MNSQNKKNITIGGHADSECRIKGTGSGSEVTVEIADAYYVGKHVSQNCAKQIDDDYEA